MKSRHQKKIAYLLSLLFIFVCWFTISAIVKSDLIFPSPKTVFFHFFKLVKTYEFWICFSGTFLRILAAFGITVFAGSLIGFLCGFNQFFYDFFQIPLQLVRTTPVVAVILIVLFWFKSTVVPVFICSLMSLPIMITSVATGFRQNNKNLAELSQIYCLSKFQYFCFIKIPLCKSYFFNGALQTFGLCWKVVIASEVLCLPKKSLGYIMQKSQMNLETADIAAITIFMIFISFVIEKLAEKLLKTAFIEMD